MTFAAQGCRWAGSRHLRAMSTAIRTSRVAQRAPYPTLDELPRCRVAWPLSGRFEVVLVRRLNGRKPSEDDFGRGAARSWTFRAPTRWAGAGRIPTSKVESSGFRYGLPAGRSLLCVLGIPGHRSNGVFGSVTSTCATRPFASFVRRSSSGLPALPLPLAVRLDAEVRSK